MYGIKYKEFPQPQRVSTHSNMETFVPFVWAKYSSCIFVCHRKKTGYRKGFVPSTQWNTELGLYCVTFLLIHYDQLEICRNELWEHPATCLHCDKINFLIPTNTKTDKWLTHSMAVLILIDCCQLFLNDVMDSPDWLGADSWYRTWYCKRRGIKHGAYDPN